MKKILAPLFALVLLCSCSNSDDNSVTANPDEKYLDGVFVTNEGNFTKGNASISHINGNLTSITNDVFRQANGRSIGDVAQSMVVTDKYVFAVMNNSNTIEVVNKKTFKSVFIISDKINSPRYAVIKNNKLYVTSLKEAAVNVYNAETFAFIKKIDLNNTVEKIVVANNYIYAANEFYSGGKLVEVINPETDTNTVDITFDNAINGLATNGEVVYVLTANDTTTNISLVNNTTISTTKVLEQPIGRNLVVSGSDIFYTAGTGVYKMNNSLTSASKLFDVTAGDEYSILYGFNVLNGLFYTADANNYTNNCKVVIYRENGTIVKEFTAGIGTNGFYKF